MEEKVITPETLELIKTMPRMPYETYKELISIGVIKRIVKLRQDRTIFVDEENGSFFYVNPYWKQLHKCGVFIETEVDNG
jgi:hypothetical protein